MTAVYLWSDRVARVLLGGIFLYAGVTKFGDPQGLADSIYTYDLLPQTLINPLAAGLPVLEMVLGTMLLCGLARRVSATLTVLLYATFVFALGQAMIRGLKIDCGCFGNADGWEGSAFVALARDMILLGAAVFVFRAAGLRPANRQAELNDGD